ncbi:MAG: LPS assembly protein LptD [Magnetococcus sp. YQC-9]
MKRDIAHPSVHGARRGWLGARPVWLPVVSLLLISCLGSAGLRAEEKAIDIDSDRMDIDHQNRSVTARGKVKLSQPEVLDLQADEATYFIDKREILASGNVRLVRGSDLFTSDAVRYNFATHTGVMERASGLLKGSKGNIRADKVEFHNQNTFSMDKGRYTTCACEPNQAPSWELVAEIIDVDREQNTLTAHGASLRLGDVPVLWSPWWQHPFVPKRQSGFLYPVMRASGGNGFEMDIPYYWDIAPDRDATFALHPTSRRGVLTKAQYRYMGENYKGSLDTLNIYDTVEERHRGLTLFTHRQDVESWELDARLAASQTRDFLHDFQQKKLVDSRERRLESHLVADRLWLRQSGYTNFEAGSLWYENLDATNDRFTVQRLPYLNFTDDRPLHALDRAVDGPGPGGGPGRFSLHNEAKFDSFYQLSGDAAQRFDLAPELQYWRSLPIGHFSGAFGLRDTGYLIQGDPNQTGRDFAPTVSRESASLRARLDLDLSRTYGDGFWKHTLEPAVQYALISSTDQSRLPNFDSRLRNFTVSNLYAGNLYSGDDRVSAGQWVAYGLTSRLYGRLNDGGIRNLMSATIGQRWAPEGDREYQQGYEFSNVVAGVELSPWTHWMFSLGGRYNPHQNVMEYTETGANYSDANVTVGMGYHRNRPDLAVSTLPAGTLLAEGSQEPLEDLSLRTNLRLDENWRWKQNADYSLEYSAIKSWRTGLAYEHSCWSLELSGGRDLSSQTSEHGGGFIGFFLMLRGLGGYGFSS